MTIRPLSTASIDCFRTDGSLMDLARPLPAEVDFAVMAGRLSRIARFSGAPKDGAFSVAQHCVMGAETLLAEGEDELTAALFLLHDGHEFLIGDKTRPFQSLLAAVLAYRHGAAMGQALHLAIADIKAGWDEAIYTAARLPPPSAWTNRQRMTVHQMDQRMLHAEAQALFGRQAGEWVKTQKALKPLPWASLKIWGPMLAEERFTALFKKLRGYQLFCDVQAAHRAHVAASAPKTAKRG
jgi:5'-deoxynucleotidase YfbR-like HD superfamily hydrolase